ncbi:universal stress protein [Myceligenerans pegani]|uniref:Universal stress protein n=1 Tax=Myceligenerans pegani TaxID=2776917 RepID=A0ABR9N0R2_9MICO|nr:universal stress protein [Myceligenerans sp. TRM 65318]MBE1877244.1 universal stress protein [Myceligenerans sp. TRM 65318]MBE3019515.1 universal stress protein [Myceligenerans sp. TRM 65318]
MTIVVGNLATAEGQAALDAAVAEAEERRTSLVVVAGPGEPGRDPGELTERLRAVGVEVRLEPGTGDLADDLVRIALETGAELMVIGLRRRSPVGKLILGSGAQRILIEAPCPVLAVKV